MSISLSGKRITVKAVAALAATMTYGAAATPSQADLVYYEGFDYGDVAGSLATLGASGGWSGDSQIGYVSTSLDYAGLPTTGGSAIGYTDNGTKYTVTNMFGDASIPTSSIGGKFYLSFLISMHETDIPSGTGSSAAVTFYVPQNPFPTSADDSGARSIQVPWDSSNDDYHYNFNPIVGASTNHSDTTLMVFYFPGGGASIEYWINPTPGVEPGSGVSTGVAAYLNRISGLSFSAQNLLVELDEIRIGTTFDDVVPVPEPAGLALAGLGGILMLARRRRVG